MGCVGHLVWFGLVGRLVLALAVVWGSVGFLVDVYCCLFVLRQILHM